MRFPLLALPLWPALSYVPLVGVRAQGEAPAEGVSASQSQISAEVTGVVPELLAGVAKTGALGPVAVRGQERLFRGATEQVLP